MPSIGGCIENIAQVPGRLRQHPELDRQHSDLDFSEVPVLAFGLSEVPVWRLFYFSTVLVPNLDFALVDVLIREMLSFPQRDRCAKSKPFHEIKQIAWFKVIIILVLFLHSENPKTKNDSDCRPKETIKSDKLLARCQPP